MYIASEDTRTSGTSDDVDCCTDMNSERLSGYGDALESSTCASSYAVVVQR